MLFVGFVGKHATTYTSHPPVFQLDNRWHVGHAVCVNSVACLLYFIQYSTQRFAVLEFIFNNKRTYALYVSNRG
jgi:hypothetical protein